MKRLILMFFSFLFLLNENLIHKKIVEENPINKHEQTYILENVSNQKTKEIIFMTGFIKLRSDQNKTHVQ